MSYNFDDETYSIIKAMRPDSLSPNEELNENLRQLGSSYKLSAKDLIKKLHDCEVLEKGVQNPNIFEKEISDITVKVEEFLTKQIEKGNLEQPVSKEKIAKDSQAIVENIEHFNLRIANKTKIDRQVFYKIEKEYNSNLADSVQHIDIIDLLKQKEIIVTDKLKDSIVLDNQKIAEFLNDRQLSQQDNLTDLLVQKIASLLKTSLTNQPSVSLQQKIKAHFFQVGNSFSSRFLHTVKDLPTLLVDHTRLGRKLHKFVLSQKWAKGSTIASVGLTVALTSLYFGIVQVFAFTFVVSGGILASLFFYFGAMNLAFGDKIWNSFVAPTEYGGTVTRAEKVANPLLHVESQAIDFVSEKTRTIHKEYEKKTPAIDVVYTTIKGNTVDSVVNVIYQQPFQVTHEVELGANSNNNRIVLRFDPNLRGEYNSTTNSYCDYEVSPIYGGVLVKVKMDSKDNIRAKIEKDDYGLEELLAAIESKLPRQKGQGNKEQSQKNKFNGLDLDKEVLKEKLFEATDTLRNGVIYNQNSEDHYFHWCRGMNSYLRRGEARRDILKEFIKQKDEVLIENDVDLEYLATVLTQGPRNLPLMASAFNEAMREEFAEGSRDIDAADAIKNFITPALIKKALPLIEAFDFGRDSIQTLQNELQLIVQTEMFEFVQSADFASDFAKMLEGQLFEQTPEQLKAIDEKVNKTRADLLKHAETLERYARRVAFNLTQDAAIEFSSEIGLSFLRGNLAVADQRKLVKALSIVAFPQSYLRREASESAEKKVQKIINVLTEGEGEKILVEAEKLLESTNKNDNSAVKGGAYSYAYKIEDFANSAQLAISLLFKERKDKLDQIYEANLKTAFKTLDKDKNQILVREFAGNNSKLLNSRDSLKGGNGGFIYAIKRHFDFNNTLFNDDEIERYSLIIDKQIGPVIADYFNGLVDALQNDTDNIPLLEKETVYWNKILAKYIKSVTAELNEIIDKNIKEKTIDINRGKALKNKLSEIVDHVANNSLDRLHSDIVFTADGLLQNVLNTKDDLANNIDLATVFENISSQDHLLTGLDDSLATLNGFMDSYKDDHKKVILNHSVGMIDSLLKSVISESQHGYHSTYQEIHDQIGVLFGGSDVLQLENIAAQKRKAETFPFNLVQKLTKARWFNQYIAEGKKIATVLPEDIKVQQQVAEKDLLKVLERHGVTNVNEQNAILNKILVNYQRSESFEGELNETYDQKLHRGFFGVSEDVLLYQSSDYKAGRNYDFVFSEDWSVASEVRNPAQLIKMLSNESVLAKALLAKDDGFQKLINETQLKIKKVEEQIDLIQGQVEANPELRLAASDPLNELQGEKAAIDNYFVKEITRILNKAINGELLLPKNELQNLPIEARDYQELVTYLGGQTLDSKQIKLINRRIIEYFFNLELEAKNHVIKVKYGFDAVLGLGQTSSGQDNLTQLKRELFKILSPAQNSNLKSQIEELSYLLEAEDLSSEEITNFWQAYINYAKYKDLLSRFVTSDLMSQECPTETEVVLSQTITEQIISAKEKGLSMNTVRKNFVGENNINSLTLNVFTRGYSLKNSSSSLQDIIECLNVRKRPSVIKQYQSVAKKFKSLFHFDRSSMHYKGRSKAAVWDDIIGGEYYVPAIIKDDIYTILDSLKQVRATGDKTTAFSQIAREFIHESTSGYKSYAGNKMNDRGHLYEFTDFIEAFAAEFDVQEQAGLLVFSENSSNYDSLMQVLNIFQKTTKQELQKLSEIINKGNSDEKNKQQYEKLVIQDLFLMEIQNARLATSRRRGATFIIGNDKDNLNLRSYLQSIYRIWRPSTQTGWARINAHIGLNQNSQGFFYHDYSNPVAVAQLIGMAAHNNYTGRREGLKGSRAAEGCGQPHYLPTFRYVKRTAFHKNIDDHYKRAERYVFHLIGWFDEKSNEIRKKQSSFKPANRAEKLFFLAYRVAKRYDQVLGFFFKKKFVLNAFKSKDLQRFVLAHPDIFELKKDKKGNVIVSRIKTEFTNKDAARLLELAGSKTGLDYWRAKSIIRASKHWPFASVLAAATTAGLVLSGFLSGLGILQLSVVFVGLSFLFRFVFLRGLLYAPQALFSGKLKDRWLNPGSARVSNLGGVKGKPRWFLFKTGLYVGGGIGGTILLATYIGLPFATIFFGAFVGFWAIKRVAVSLGRALLAGTFALRAGYSKLFKSATIVNVKKAQDFQELLADRKNDKGFAKFYFRKNSISVDGKMSVYEKNKVDNYIAEKVNAIKNEHTGSSALLISEALNNLKNKRNELIKNFNSFEKKLFADKAFLINSKTTDFTMLNNRLFLFMAMLGRNDFSVQKRDLILQEFKCIFELIAAEHQLKVLYSENVLDLIETTLRNVTLSYQQGIKQLEEKATGINRLLSEIDKDVSAKIAESFQQKNYAEINAELAKIAELENISAKTKKGINNLKNIAYCLAFVNSAEYRQLEQLVNVQMTKDLHALGKQLNDQIIKDPRIKLLNAQQASVAKLFEKSRGKYHWNYKTSKSYLLFNYDILPAAFAPVQKVKVYSATYLGFTAVEDKEMQDQVRNTHVLVMLGKNEILKSTLPKLKREEMFRYFDVTGDREKIRFKTSVTAGDLKNQPKLKALWEYAQVPKPWYLPVLTVGEDYSSFLAEVADDASILVTQMTRWFSAQVELMKKIGYELFVGITRSVRYEQVNKLTEKLVETSIKEGHQVDSNLIKLSFFEKYGKAGFSGLQNAHILGHFNNLLSVFYPFMGAFSHLSSIVLGAYIIFNIAVFGLTPHFWIGIFALNAFLQYWVVFHNIYGTLKRLGFTKKQVKEMLAINEMISYMLMTPSVTAFFHLTSMPFVVTPVDLDHPNKVIALKEKATEIQKMVDEEERKKTLPEFMTLYKAVYSSQFSSLKSNASTRRSWVLAFLNLNVNLVLFGLSAVFSVGGIVGLFYMVPFFSPMNIFFLAVLPWTFIKIRTIMHGLYLIAKQRNASRPVDALDEDIKNNKKLNDEFNKKTT